MKKMVPYFGLLTLFVSCGGYNSSSSDYTPPPSNTPQEEQSQGTFRALLSPENPSVSSATGGAEIKIQDDSFEAKVVLISARNVAHPQHIHTGTRCPTKDDDTNKDGVIDAVEASAVYGGVLVPLDSDLSNGTVDSFPTGVGYNYSEAASLSQMLSNMGMNGLNVEGKVLNIHGVPDSVNLPATVQGSKADFPIACGILMQNNATSIGTAN